METTALAIFRETVQYSGQNIWVKPVCEFFKLDVQNQYRKIKNDPILGKLYGKNTADFKENGELVGKNTADLGEIDNNGRILLSKKGFLRWIQIINGNTINGLLRERFIIFQELIFDYLYGSAHDEEQIKIHYSRLQKLEKLYGKVGAEIKREKSIVATFLNGRYTQLSLHLNTEH
jgi:hypothetical protein